ncbi:hypothetical protein F2Q70_00023321 [Brassica cretica]|uniref:ribonuclease Z n=1 Tax=Brassica cretica TaxID=69181 RepID=A0A8S9GK85_BRACR|nr:hypothetical protein F2Q70_00023321 [Brassica cretica]
MLSSMPHHNLTLLGFSPLKSSSFALFLRPFSLYPILASSPRRPRAAGYRRGDPSPRFPPRRKWSSFEEESRQRKGMSSSSDSFEFNKRRAEGKDKIDKPKKSLKRNTRTLNPTNTIAYVQILGTGMDTQDTSPSVLLFFDKQRFIFNAGEGLQRFCTEHKIKLSKVDHIFLSRVCSETAGGLPGLLLTLAGIGEDGLSVNVWGPSDLKYLVDAMRSFIPRAAMCFGSSLGENVSAENLLKFTLRPHVNLGFDRSCIPSQLTSSRVIDELLSEIPEISSKTEEVKRLWNGPHNNKMMIEEPWLNESTVPSCLENIRRDDMEIVLLGTGSSQPSRYRNVSAVYIDLFSRGSILLDCGEGTLGQLKRRYGLEGADEAVRNLKCIWISHIHADHHTGLARILARRRELLKEGAHEPVMVVGPRPLKNFLDAYQRLEDLDMEFLDCRNTTSASWASLETTSPEKTTSNGSAEGSLFSKGSPMQSIYKRPSSPVTDNASALPYLKKLKRVLGEMGLEDLISFPVVHCPQAFGVVLKAAERKNMAGDKIPGWKTVYSGDTRPCPQMVEASKGATVLIHEVPVNDNKSFLSEVVGIGSASIKQGISSFAQGHLSNKNESGSSSYRGPNLHRSLTLENENSGRYDPVKLGSDGKYGVSKNTSGGSWGHVSGEAASESSGSVRLESKTREEKLLETVVTSGGVRLQPTRDALHVFILEAAKMDTVALSIALEGKLQSPMWQVRMKALCVLEAILRKKEDGNFSIVHTYFSENTDVIQRCADSPQSSLREKANKVLSLLIGGQSKGFMSSSENTVKQETPVDLPDLIDTGILGSQSSGLIQNPMVPGGVMPFNFPPGMMMNPAFASQPLNYAAMASLLAQQQQYLGNISNFQQFGNMNAQGSGNVLPMGTSGGSQSAFPDIFQPSFANQAPTSTMNGPKKEDTRAFDFISDHLSSARDTKRIS